MLIVTTDTVVGHSSIKTLGLVMGYGSPSPFTSGIERQREESWDKARHSMNSQARALGANAIVALRIEWHGSIAAAYGTAVVLEPTEVTSQAQLEPL